MNYTYRLPAAAPLPSLGLPSQGGSSSIHTLTCMDSPASYSEEDESKGLQPKVIGRPSDLPVKRLDLSRDIRREGSPLVKKALRTLGALSILSVVFGFGVLTCQGRSVKTSGVVPSSKQEEVYALFKHLHKFEELNVIDLNEMLQRISLSFHAEYKPKGGDGGDIYIKKGTVSIMKLGEFMPYLNEETGKLGDKYTIEITEVKKGNDKEIKAILDSMIKAKDVSRIELHTLSFLKYTHDDLIKYGTVQSSKKFFENEKTEDEKYKKEQQFITDGNIIIRTNSEEFYITLNESRDVSIFSTIGT